MAREFTLALLVLAFSISVTAQGARIRVPSDVAATHVKNRPSPTYPSFAQTARISGGVVLHIAIDANGNVAPIRVISGHPLLVDAAVENVRHWKYIPFEANGHPVEAVTVVRVQFGSTGKTHEEEDKARIVFQDKFWATMDRAQTAIQKSELELAKQALADANNELSLDTSSYSHVPERWQWEMVTGALEWQLKRFDKAEQHYREALKLYKDRKDAPECAGAHSALGRLYYESSKPDLARESLNNAVSIYLKNYKSADGKAGGQKIYARGIAEDAWMLSRIAAAEHQNEELTRQCRVVVEFKNSLPEGDPKSRDCEQFLSAATTK